MGESQKIITKPHRPRKNLSPRTKSGTGMTGGLGQIYGPGVFTVNFVDAPDHQFIQCILIKCCDVGLFRVMHQR